MKKILFSLLAVMLLVAFAAAQVPTGKIVGKVKDDQGAPLPGVSVEATSAKLVGKATAVTDETGTYRLFTLPSGTYSIVYALQGFQPVKREGVVLQLEQTITLDIALKQSTLAEEITVVGKSPLIDVKSTTKGSTMTKEVFMQLPRNRNFDGLLSTVPGVQYEGNQGGLSVDGASGGENMFYIDGTNITNVHLGTQAQGIVMEQLEEVKVTASGYSAEFGGSMGGVVNVISRSGGNEFHGDVFGYYNNNKNWMQGKGRDYLRLNPYAYPYVAEYHNDDDYYFNGGSNRDNYQRWEGVFNLGGFIVKDRLWFFASFNPVYSYTYANRWFTADPATMPAPATVTTVDDVRLGRPMSEFYVKNWNYNGQAKLTAQPFKGLRMALSYVNNFSKYRGSIPSADGVSAKNNPWIASWPNTILTGKDPGFDYPNWSGNATIDYTASNNFLISLRGGYFYQNINNQQQFMPTTRWYFGRTNIIASEPYASIPADLKHDAGWTNWAGATNQLNAREYTRLSANLDLTYYMNLAGEHAWKFGVQFIRLGENVDDTRQHPMVTLNWGPQGYYDWPDGRRVQGAYGEYEIRSDWVSPYGYFWNQHSDNWALYLQDSWTIGDRFTLNFGLRTESEYVPSFATTDPVLSKVRPIKFGFDKKMAPRLGAIYDVFGDSSLKVFASWGIYYDVMKLYLAEGSYGGFKWWTSYYNLDNYNWPSIAASGDINNKADQAAGGAYFGSRNWRVPNFDSTDPGMLPVSQSEVSFGAEKKITEEISFSARFVYKHLIRTIEDVGVLDAELNESYYLTNPGFGWATPISEGGRFNNDFWRTPKAKREYYALNLTLEKRFSNNWQGGFNYTWSQLKGNYGGLFSSDENGRAGPNQERYFDLYFERYDLHGKPLDGNLPSDRTHYMKAYGSYAFPFGLTVGVVAYGRGGLPRATSIPFNDVTVFPDGYFDTGKRTPFTLWADLYVEYNLRILKKYVVNLNVTINNATNTSTAQGYFDTPFMNMLRWTDAQVLAQTANYVDWHSEIAAHTVDPRYGLVTGYFGSWSMRFGARFSF
jgi:Carboxypeptidase regulatory-like domain/TonB-dependent Receptor Plug Domain